jgi:protein ImuB
VPSTVSSSRQRILSLWLRRLSTDRLRRQWRENEAARGAAAAPLSFSAEIGEPAATGSLPGKRGPLAIVGKRGNAERLVAVDAEAEELGLAAGLTLAEARAMYPGLTVAEEDAAADARMLDALADWCVRYTPLVGLDAPAALLLDIGGCAHLFGGERALLDDLVTRLARMGFGAHAAIADTIGSAWAAARFSATCIVAPGTERALLAPLPLAALRLSGETIAVLKRVGLKRVADIADLPRSPLAARFGTALLRQLDRALGREGEPLNPRLPVPPYFAEQRFAEPIAREDDVLAVIQRLAARLAAVLERRGEGARRIALQLFRTDGAVQRIEAGTSRPMRDPQAVRELFTERLAALADVWDPGFGFDLARLAVIEAEAAPPRQVGLAGRDDDTVALDQLADRLAARLGRQHVGRPVAQDSHIPELAAVIVPAQARAAHEKDGWAAFRDFRTATDLAPRPLRLLVKPEPIRVTPMEVDQPPRRFQWRRAWHEVAFADGPERIEAAWWRDEHGRARDYFRVEDGAGRRFWLFRAGLYREQEWDDRPPAWFMHGFFA